jgi:hypothetical protein
MTGLAWFFGAIGGLCMVLGIITAVGVVQQFGAELTWTFWFMLSGILFLASIALVAGSRGGGGEY